jgi:chromosome segregation ATPase
MPKSPSDTLQPKERFDALVRDRDSLRAEVTDMRKSLEELQSKHRAEMEALQHKLNDAESKKEHAESQFQKLLERVNTIKSQLGERLKEDAVRKLMFDSNRFPLADVLIGRNCPS